MEWRKRNTSDEGQSFFISKHLTTFDHVKSSFGDSFCLVVYVIQKKKKSALISVIKMTDIRADFCPCTVRSHPNC